MGEDFTGVERLIAQACQPIHVKFGGNRDVGILCRVRFTDVDTGKHMMAVTKWTVEEAIKMRDELDFFINHTQEAHDKHLKELEEQVTAVAGPPISKLQS